MGSINQGFYDGRRSWFLKQNIGRERESSQGRKLSSKLEQYFNPIYMKPWAMLKKKVLRKEDI